jgi:hypothetical protein
VLDLNRICPANDELARYEYAAALVPSDAVANPPGQRILLDSEDPLDEFSDTL